MFCHRPSFRWHNIPIAASDVHYRLSGGAVNTDVNASIGGAKSSTAITDNVLTNLWDNVTGPESGAGDIEYRCIYIHNNHGSLTLLGAKVWISSLTASSDDEIDIGLGSSAVGTATEEQLIANESTAPTGVSFSRPTSAGAALVIGDMLTLEHKALWVRRTVNAGAAAYSNNVYTLTVEGETLA